MKFELNTSLFIFSLCLSFLPETNGDVVDGYGSINNSSAYGQVSEIGEITPCLEVRITLRIYNPSNLWSERLACTGRN